MTLEEIRRRIDEVDDRILELWMERMALSKAAGEAKKAQGLTTLQEGREKRILQKVDEKTFPLNGYARTVYGAILAASRAYQEEK